MLQSGKNATSTSISLNFDQCCNKKNNKNNKGINTLDSEDTEK